jgi:hypothetical protein
MFGIIITKEEREEREDGKRVEHLSDANKMLF